MLERQKKQLDKLADKSNSRVEEIIVQTLYIIFFIAYNLFEVYLIYLIGKYSNKISELVLIVLCFFVNKAVYGKPLHFSNNFICFQVIRSSSSQHNFASLSWVAKNCFAISQQWIASFIGFPNP